MRCALCLKIDGNQPACRDFTSCHGDTPLCMTSLIMTHNRFNVVKRCASIADCWDLWFNKTRLRPDCMDAGEEHVPSSRAGGKSRECHYCCHTPKTELHTWCNMASSTAKPNNLIDMNDYEDRLVLEAMENQTHTTDSSRTNENPTFATDASRTTQNPISSTDISLTLQVSLQTTDTVRTTMETTMTTDISPTTTEIATNTTDIILTGEEATNASDNIPISEKIINTTDPALAEKSSTNTTFTDKPAEIEIENVTMESNNSSQQSAQNISSTKGATFVSELFTLTPNNSLTNVTMKTSEQRDNQSDAATRSSSSQRNVNDTELAGNQTKHVGDTSSTIEDSSTATDFSNAIGNSTNANNALKTHGNSKNMALIASSSNEVESVVTAKGKDLANTTHDAHKTEDVSNTSGTAYISTKVRDAEQPVESTHDADVGQEIRELTDIGVTDAVKEIQGFRHDMDTAQETQQSTHALNIAQEAKELAYNTATLLETKGLTHITHDAKKVGPQKIKHTFDASQEKQGLKHAIGSAQKTQRIKYGTDTV
ncbi:hypothetical protein PoB_003247300 [Plakobranchus ocellatus]|uniref:Uncharacterized protein n=1 Tax=Plakobranchus ocellatus TaxID=259542 RepID=A0AAV4AHF7_9GAST|nr:hypothetical protein PoB_003247300 [Plakobranchus ocellatus]